jgi:hypothetical protein
MIVRWDTQDMSLTATVVAAPSRAVPRSAQKPRLRRDRGGAPKPPVPPCPTRQPTAVQFGRPLLFTGEITWQN